MKIKDFILRSSWEKDELKLVILIKLKWWGSAGDLIYYNLFALPHNLNLTQILKPYNSSMKLKFHKKILMRYELNILDYCLLA